MGRETGREEGDRRRPACGLRRVVALLRSSQIPAAGGRRGGGWRLSSGPPRSRRAAGSCAAPRTAAADSSHGRHSRRACGVPLRPRLALPPFLSWVRQWYFSSVRLLEYLHALSLLSFPRALPSCFSRTAARLPALRPPKIGRLVFFPPARVFFGRHPVLVGRLIVTGHRLIGRPALVELIVSVPQNGH